MHWCVALHLASMLTGLASMLTGTFINFLARLVSAFVVAKRAAPRCIIATGSCQGSACATRVAAYACEKNKGGGLRLRKDQRSEIMEPKNRPKQRATPNRAEEPADSREWSGSQSQIQA
jgi:hypothetical protein